MSQVMSHAMSLEHRLRRRFIALLASALLLPAGAQAQDADAPSAQVPTADAEAMQILIRADEGVEVNGVNIAIAGAAPEASGDDDAPF